MIINEIILCGYGFPIDRAIPVEALRTAIIDSELSTIREVLGDDILSQLAAMADNDPALVGGTVNGKNVTGYNRAAAHIAFAHLLVLVNTQATAFGAVKKKDDYSNAVDWFGGAKYYETMGLAGLRELCDAEGWHYNTPSSITTEG